MAKAKVKWTEYRWYLVPMACLAQADRGVDVFYHSRIDGLLLEVGHG